MINNIKQLVVQRLLKLVSQVPKVREMIYRLSLMYIDIFRGFSYDFEANGEKQLLERSATLWRGRIVFFDVGANVGDWTAQAIFYYKDYEAHLFEMTTQTYANLKERYANNSRIKINNLALSNKNEEKSYRDYGENYGGNTLLTEAKYHDRRSSLRKVICVSGESYCIESGVSHINFLKIDTEGAEFSVLQGFENLLSRKAIDVIQFEYGYTHADAHTLMGDFYRLLESYGYIIGALRKNGVHFKEFSYADNDFKSGPNYVACLPEFRDKLACF